MLVSSIIAGALALIALIIFVIVPMVSSRKEVIIPDVVGMSESKATKKLKSLGLKVNAEVKEKESDEIEEGSVIKTNPSVGKKVKKGTSITFTISTGKDKIVLENYVGKDYESVKYLLEEKGITVDYEEKEYTEDDNIKNGSIVEQSIKKGEELEKGDSITFKVAKVITVYPDFVNGAYTLSEVEKFCKDNNITLESVERKTNEYAENTIITQSRTAGTKVVSGVTLRVTYAVKKEETNTETKSENESKNEETKTNSSSEAES